MRGKITVSGAGEVAEQLRERDACEILDVTDTAPGPDMRGSGVVIGAPGVDLAACYRFAPAAVLVIAGDDVGGRVRETLKATLLPRTRVLGVATGDAAKVAEAIVLEHETEVRAAVYCRGENGIENEVAEVDVVVGRGGLRRIV